MNPIYALLSIAAVSVVEKVLGKANTQAGSNEAKTIESTEAKRILEEWKVNVDLHKFHDNLKHQRITHFLSAQGGLFAFYGLLMQPAEPSVPVWGPLLALSVAVIAEFHIQIHKEMDMRARAFVDVVKTRLLILERQWRALFPDSPIETYTHQWGLLTARNPELIGEYDEALKSAMVTDLNLIEKAVGPKPANQGEKNIFTILAILWGFLIVGAVCRTTEGMNYVPPKDSNPTATSQPQPQIDPPASTPLPDLIGTSDAGKAIISPTNSAITPDMPDSPDNADDEK
jgi:hypothetical protein